jgi:adenosylmethionine-8-amino-7-oxononanoate aminotransferase
MAESNVLHKWGGGLDPDFPRIESAHDEFLVTADGEEIVDAASGAAVANLGHSVEGIGAVAAEQADRLGYISQSHFGAEPTERLAGQVAELTPDPLNAVFFVTSGSEAIESAIKLARKYHCQRGNPAKDTVVSRWQSYHGATLGALAASGNTGRRTTYQPLLADWPKIPPAYPYRWDHDGTPEEQARAAAHKLEQTIRRVGPETVAAFVAEPVSGSSIPAAHPHLAYFAEVRRICDEYDVLFVVDEVMTGFGRTGEPFACERFDVVPDILAVGKGLSAGYAPISAAVVHDDVAAAFHSDADGSFDHGHTYSGHPVSAAVASHIVDRYDDDLLARGQAAGDHLVNVLAPLREHPMVGEIRQCGLMIGVEFVADRETKAPFDPDLDVAERIYDRAIDDGVYIYPGTGSVDGVAGDHCMLAPPLTTSEASLDTVAETLVPAVDSVHDAVTD